VGKATDIQSRVRSYFTGDRRPKVGRLLRQLYAIQFRVCPGAFTASVIEGRMIRALNPSYNRQGRARRARSVSLVGRSEGESVARSAAGSSAVAVSAAGGSAVGGRRRLRRGRIEARVDVAGDPVGLLAPLMAEVAVHAAAQRYEEAGAVRDDAKRLRNAIVRHRRTEALRGTGCLVLEICGEGTVELHNGLFVEGGMLVPAVDRAVSPSGLGPDNPLSPDATDQDQDRAVAAQWLHANAELVRVVHSEHGFSWPAVRIPELMDLSGSSCGVGAVAVRVPWP
jgi:excinuclease UvrABC nuclease subunit